MKSSNQTVAQYREYLFNDEQSGEYSSLTYTATKEDFVKAIENLLDEYKLGERLAAAKAGGYKLRFLEYSCGEGLYLHGLAEVLEKRGWLDAAEILGIDKEESLIATAEEYAKVSKPPRPYLHFYTHSFNLPLDAHPLLRDKNGQAAFDLILLTQSLLGQSNDARYRLLRIYRENLKPGGIIHLREFVTKTGPEGCISLHPSMQPFTEACMIMLRGLNPGYEVAREASSWLAEAGAEQVQALVEDVPLGGATRTGMNLVRATILAMRRASPYFIAQGLLKQTEYDEIMRVVFHELTPKNEGKERFIRTIARKPI